MAVPKSARNDQQLIVPDSIEFCICRFVLEALDQESNSLQWHEPVASTPPDWNKHKKCLAVAIFVVSRRSLNCANSSHGAATKPPGAISLTPFGTIREQSLSLPAEAQTLLRLLLRQLRETPAAYGVLSDQMSSVVIDHRFTMEVKTIMALSRVPLDMVPVRGILAWCIYNGIQAWGLCLLPRQRLARLYHGALGNPSENSQHNDKPKKWFSDFDIYTMQRVPEAWSKFCAWHAEVRNTALKHTILPGMKFMIAPHSFSHRHALCRSLYSFPKLPPDTLDSVTHACRDSNDMIKHILNTQESPTFTVLEMKAGGPEHWSQVFYGRVEGSDEVLCLKVFDERYFNIPLEHEAGFDDFDSMDRLVFLNVSEDLIRREETVYHRLERYQGALLPQCYGFHLVRTQFSNTCSC